MWLPGLKVHRFIDITFFGKSYYKIHREIDYPVKFLGRGHRILNHDPISAYFIAKRNYPQDPAAILAANYHLIYDDICSRNPEYKKFLERLAELNSKKRKKRAKGKRSRKSFSLTKGDPLLKRVADDIHALETLKTILRTSGYVAALFQLDALQKLRKRQKKLRK